MTNGLDQRVGSRLPLVARGVRAGSNGDGGGPPAPPDANLVFTDFRDKVRDWIGDDAWRRWGSFRLGDSDARRVRLVAPSEQRRAELLRRISMEKLRSWWTESDPAHRTIVVVAEDEMAQTEQPEPATSVGGGQQPPKSAPPPAPGAPTPMRFENFVVGDSNREAHALAMGIAAPGDSPFRLATIYGAYGVGKSHLLSAIELAVGQANDGRKVLYIGADRFREDYVRSLRKEEGLAFKERVRQADILLIDDLQVLAGSTKTQNELFSALVERLSSGARVVFTADRHPEKLAELDDRLRQRLEASVAARVDAPDLPLRRRILERMADENPAARGGPPVPMEVLDQIASAITSTPRELEGALSSVLLKTRVIGRPLTRESATEALSERMRGSAKRVTIEEIQKIVATFHGLKWSDLLSSSRARDIVRPRQMAMYLCRLITRKSYPQLGQRFSRDHTTVMHACTRIEELCASDPAVRAEIEELKRLVRMRNQAE